MNYMQLAALICAVLAIAIPFGIKFYKTSQALVREKNWPRLVEAVSHYMMQAETLFEVGADKKAWVLTMIQTTADEIDYDLTEQDMKNLSDLIDSLCEMSKVVNAEEAAE